MKRQDTKENAHNLVNEIDKLDQLKPEEFLQYILDKKTPDVTVAYFAGREDIKPIFEWYAKAVLITRERQQFSNQVLWTMIAAIASAVACISTFITLVITIKGIL